MLPLVYLQSLVTKKIIFCRLGGIVLTTITSIRLNFINCHITHTFFSLHRGHHKRTIQFFIYFISSYVSQWNFQVSATCLRKIILFLCILKDVEIINVPHTFIPVFVLQYIKEVQVLQKGLIYIYRESERIFFSWNIPKTYTMISGILEVSFCFNFSISRC